MLRLPLCYRVMLDGFEPGMFYDSRHAVLGTVLVLFFVFSMSVLLQNVVGGVPPRCLGMCNLQASTLFVVCCTLFVVARLHACTAALLLENMLR